MRVWVACAAALLALVGAGAICVASASGTGQIKPCTAVRVTGGDENGAAGTTIAAVLVKNRGTRDCTVNARPWVRLGPFRYRVTVADAAPGEYGNAGDLEQVWTLHPGQRVAAGLFFFPGSCDRGVGSMFTLNARVGWARRGVSIGGGACKNGTGELSVGSFHRR
ncbi:MAG TPA: DUF4232 domain-containing protein [Gaiellaceae bacterium]|jgi:hypothetical protein